MKDEPRSLDEIILKKLLLVNSKLKNLRITHSSIEGFSKDELQTFLEHLHDIQIHSFSLRSRLLKKNTRKYSNDPWAWYYHSTFLRYETEKKEEAFKSATKAILLLRKKNEFIGAISRNFICLAYFCNYFTELNDEIRYLRSNSNPDSQILNGVCLDIIQFSMHDAIDSEIIVKLPFEETNE